MPNFIGDDPWARLEAKLDKTIEKIDELYVPKMVPEKRFDSTIELGISLVVCSIAFVVIIYIAASFYNSRSGQDYINSAVHGLLPPD